MPNYLARLVLLGTLCTAPAFAGAFIAPRVSAVPGGVVTFRIPGPPDRVPTVVFNGRQVLVVRQQDAWLAVVGIGLSVEPGEYHVDVQDPGGGEQKLPFTVKPKTYSVQQLKVAPGQVNLSPENEERVKVEGAKVRAALDGFAR